MQFIVTLKKNSNGKKETKEYNVEAGSAHDAAMIARKQKENEDFYIYGIKKAGAMKCCNCGKEFQEYPHSDLNLCPDCFELMCNLTLEGAEDNE